MNSRMLTLSAAIVAALTATAVPEVTNVTMSQDIGRLVTVTYHLAGAPAIVTMDVVTNGVSIGDENVYRLSPPSGAVSKLIAEDGDYTITWQADRAWPDHKITDKSVQVVVTAWDPAVPPDYMVADLIAPYGVAYYTSEDALPGGLLANDDYRVSKLVMRHIHAANVEWTMGAVASYKSEADEKPHRVKMENDYFIGVFPLTQGQYCAAMGIADHTTTPCLFKAEGYWQKRIADGITYYSARGTRYPLAPTQGWLIDVLRTNTGVVFDLPGEAQWEFACRAGHDDTCWGDGTPLAGTTSEALKDNLPGRYNGNCETSVDPATVDLSGGTPWAGTYRANSWGLYDMNGGVEEFCLDWYQADITALTKGEINCDGDNYADGTAHADGNSITRGGAWYRSWDWCRTSRRGRSGWNDGGNVGGNIRGIRLAASIPATR